MVYQLPLNVALVLLIIDSVLLIWLALSWKWKRGKTVSRILTFLMFSGFSTLKLISMSPSFGASSPNDLIFKSDKEIGKLFFAMQSDDGLFVFWEAKFRGKEGVLTLEMEGIYPTGLLIFKKIEGEQFEFRPNLKTSGDMWQPIPVEVTDFEFQPISNEGEIALKNYQKVALVNYASQFLSLAFLITFLITLFIGSNNQSS